MSLPHFPNLDVFAYRDYRCEIRTGDLLFASGSTPFARVVQQASGCCWNQVGLIWRLEPFDQVLVLESHEHHGVRVLPLSRFVRSYDGLDQGYAGRLALARHRRFQECANADSLQAMANFAWGSLGRPADPLQTERLLARLMSGRIGLHPKETKSHGEWLSSEFVAGCYGQLGLHLPCLIDESTTTPADITRDSNLLWLCELEVELEQANVEAHAAAF